MLDTFNDLTWQFQVLVCEAILSIVLAFILARMGYFNRPRSLRSVAVSLVWDVTVIVLFLTGGATNSWQHILYLIAYLWAMGSAITGYGKAPNPNGPNSKSWSGTATLIAVALGLITIYLLVAGR